MMGMLQAWKLTTLCAIGPTVQGIQIMKEIVKNKWQLELKIPHFG